MRKYTSFSMLAVNFSGHFTIAHHEGCDTSSELDFVNLKQTPAWTAHDVQDAHRLKAQRGTIGRGWKKITQRPSPLAQVSFANHNPFNLLLRPPSTPSAHVLWPIKHPSNAFHIRWMRIHKWPKGSSICRSFARQWALNGKMFLVVIQFQLSYPPPPTSPDSPPLQPLDMPPWLPFDH